MDSVRDRIVEFLRTHRNQQTHSFLSQILRDLDQPYDLNWFKEVYGLSPTEFRVLDMLVRGHTAGTIAESTGNQISTIRVHISRIYKRANVKNYNELVGLILERAFFK